MNTINNNKRKFDIEVVLRPRIFEALDANAHYPITWLEGNAGAGKTTLVQSYLNTRHSEYCWYTFSEMDADSFGLSRYLVNHFKQKTPALSKLSSSLQLPINIPKENLLRSILNEIQEASGQTITLVLDDIHCIQSVKLLEDIASVLDAVNTEYLRLYLISRYQVPPEFSQLILHRKIHYCDSELLAWSYSEAVELSKSLLGENWGRFNRKNFELSRGWVSGIVLMLEQLRYNELIEEKIAEKSQQYVFHYFVSEVFRSISKSERELLMTISLLPEIDLKRDAALASKRELSKLLDGLMKRNYFVYPKEGSKRQYTLHPLFKSFLQSALEKEFQTEEMRNLKVNVANNLVTSGQREWAYKLYIETGSWNSLCDCIRADTNSFAATNTPNYFVSLAESIPESILQENGWLLYWKASTKLIFDQNSAYALFCQAYTWFEEHSDASGVFVSYCGVIESITSSFRNFSRLKYWIRQIDPLLTRYGKPKQLIVRKRLDIAVHLALLFGDPSHQDFDMWSNRVEKIASLLGIIGRPNLRILLTINLFLNNMWVGNIHKCEKLLASTDIHLHPKGVDGFSYGAWCLLKSVLLEAKGDFTGSIQISKEALQESSNSHVDYWNRHLRLQIAFNNLSLGNFTDVLNMRDELNFDMKKSNQYEQVRYYELFHHIECQLGNIEIAVDLQRQAVKLAEQLDMPLIAIDQRISYAAILLYANRYEEARDILHEQRSLSQSTNGGISLSRGEMLLVITHLALRDLKSAKKYLESAARRFQSMGVSFFNIVHRKHAIEIVKFALKENYEVEFFVNIIKNMALKVDHEIGRHENLNWRLKVYCLGEFRVVVESGEIDTTGKSQKKPLQLLRAIVSFGAKKINQSVLIENLWPDSDGDEGLRVFYTTLHRLRKIVGAEAIILRDGILSLNERLVWLDVAQFIEITTKLRRMMHERKDSSLMKDVIQDLLVRYRGKFLDRDSDEPYVFQYRMELHNKFLNLLNLLGYYCIRGKNALTALSIADRLLEIDASSEQAYQLKISALLAQGRNLEAGSIYQEYRLTMSKLHGIMPSRTIEQLDIFAE